MKALVIGVPGVGKTAVLRKAMKGKKDYEVINFGTQMLEVAKEKEIVDNRDELRNLPPEKGKKLQKETAEKISRKENILIDTHLAIETPKGILPGVPKWALDKIGLDKIILIESDPRNIRKRRKKDRSRKREDFELDPTLHQEMNRNYAAAASTLTGALVKIIKNKEGKINETAKELRKTLEER